MLKITLFALSLLPSISLAANNCPDTTLGETQEDCPWAGIARDLGSINDLKQIQKELTARAPDLARQIQEDGKKNEVIGSWGPSVNYDENAKGIIVHPPILDAIIDWAGAPPREDRMVHAGLEHSYGYLFSNLKTPFGYKRARWVKADVELGFGLSRGTLGPAPAKGTLLSNLTFLMSQFVFQGEPKNLNNAKKLEWSISPEILTLKYEKFKHIRLEEEAKGIILRTDFIAFSGQPSDQKNTHLLIYSVQKPGGKRVLITAFPVETSFVERAVKADTLGDSKPIQARYNAYVPELPTPSQPPVMGVRRMKVFAQ